MLQVARRKPDLNLSMSLAPESLVLPSAVAQLRQPHVVQGLLGPLLDVCLSRGHASCSPTSPCAASSAPSERVPHSGLNTGFNTCILCVSSSRMKDLVRKTPFLSCRKCLIIILPDTSNEQLPCNCCRNCTAQRGNVS